MFTFSIERSVHIPRYYLIFNMRNDTYFCFGINSRRLAVVSLSLEIKGFNFPSILKAPLLRDSKYYPILQNSSACIKQNMSLPTTRKKSVCNFSSAWSSVGVISKLNAYRRIRKVVLISPFTSNQRSSIRINVGQKRKCSIQFQIQFNSFHSMLFLFCCVHTACQRRAWVSTKVI